MLYFKCLNSIDWYCFGSNIFLNVFQYIMQVICQKTFYIFFIFAKLNTTCLVSWFDLNFVLHFFYFFHISFLTIFHFIYLFLPYPFFLSLSLSTCLSAHHHQFFFLLQNLSLLPPLVFSYFILTRQLYLMLNAILISHFAHRVL